MPIQPSRCAVGEQTLLASGLLALLRSVPTSRSRSDSSRACRAATASAMRRSDASRCRASAASAWAAVPRCAACAGVEDILGLASGLG